MKPRDILLRALNEQVAPRLVERGFRFVRSRLVFDRSTDEFRHGIQFSLGKWNREGSCRFWTNWAVTSPAYAKWHVNQWGTEPPNDILVALADWNIPGWSRGMQHFNLNGTRSDDDEIGVWLRDAEEAGLPFLASMSSWTAAAERLLAEKWFYHRAADFLMIAGAEERAQAVLREGGRAYASGGRTDEDDLEQIKARLSRYFSE